MEIKRGFKVTLSFTDDETGLEVRNGACGGPMNYLEGEWVSPPDGYGPLCVFDAIEDTYIFNGDVWECEYEPSDEDAIWTPAYTTPLSKLNIPGTVLADRVKLIRRVGNA